MTRLLSALLVVFGVSVIGCEGGWQGRGLEGPDTARLDTGPDHHLTHQAGEIQWQDGPPSLPPGAQIAVLEGDPAEPGLFTMRLRVPDGYRIPPHWHPNVERVTVISGTFHLGSGSQFREGAAQALEAGSYTAMPPRMRHFAWAEGRTEVQITTIGPWEIHYVDPADDPRRDAS